MRTIQRPSHRPPHANAAGVLPARMASAVRRAGPLLRAAGAILAFAALATVPLRAQARLDPPPCDTGFAADLQDGVRGAKPLPPPERWRGLIGEYGGDDDVLYILERAGRLCALIGRFGPAPLREL